MERTAWAAPSSQRTAALCFATSCRCCQHGCAALSRAREPPRRGSACVMRGKSAALRWAALRYQPACALCRTHHMVSVMGKGKLQYARMYLLYMMAAPLSTCCQQAGGAEAPEACAPSGTWAPLAVNAPLAVPRPEPSRRERTPAAPAAPACPATQQCGDLQSRAPPPSRSWLSGEPPTPHAPSCSPCPWVSWLLPIELC